ncbi:MAG TPA: DNA helicase RecQ [Candidatus Eisenbacteria bacterium]|nr:DNA helicase RecQ [Candidatus Eisenbacteria bacterium]
MIQTDSPRTLLKSVFGYDSFRSFQEDCIRSVLERRDTLLIMPTGGGKSLCYQIPALIFPGLTVVVSPLISLMTDQVRQLRALGIDASVFNSSLSSDEYDENESAVRSGRSRILFLAPETLLKPEIGSLLSGCRVDLFVIDEAHCISEWGHDFRPEYRQLEAVRRRFPRAVCLAMTATATQRVRRDILSSLGIPDANLLLASFNRDNLFYEVAAKVDAHRQTLDFLRRFPDQSGIVYCFSRDQVDTLAASLEKEGFSARPYHAGLRPEVRTRNQELFIRDDVQIIVATIAFGMGINKPNVRFVLHYNLPKNVESYYQETGRAGRDGLPAHCLLLFGYGDIRNVRFFIEQKTDPEQKQVANMHLSSIIQYAEAETCRRGPLLKYFGETLAAENCALCDNCARPKTPDFDLTDPAKKFLACIRRTGQRFGAGHVIDVLRGSSNEKILRFGHDRLAEYGTGAEFSARQWQFLIRQFIQKGYSFQDHDAYGALKCTPKSENLLSGGERLMGFFPEAREKAKKAPKKVAEPLQGDDELFQALRQLRKELADQAGVPPYIVFSDKSLLDMAARKPATREAFSALYGVGAKKLEAYADVFLRVIAEFRASRA